MSNQSGILRTKVTRTAPGTYDNNLNQIRILHKTKKNKVLIRFILDVTKPVVSRQVAADFGGQIRGLLEEFGKGLSQVSPPILVAEIRHRTFHCYAKRYKTNAFS